MQYTLQLFKVLADASRLKIINCLMEEPMYVERIAKRLELAPSTMSFHLKKLEEVGLVSAQKEQYYVMYSLNLTVLNKNMMDLIKTEEDEVRLQQQREEDYREKIIQTFFEYGKIVSIPVQQKKRRIVLEELAKVFDPEKEYTEKEINIIIADFNDDFCTLRRDLVGENLLERHQGIYRVK